MLILPVKSMPSFTLISLRNLIESKRSCREIGDELVRLLELELRERFSGVSYRWSKDLLTDFWVWLTNCQTGNQGTFTDREQAEIIRKRLSQIVNRCDSDETLFRYILRSVKNFSVKDKGFFARFARAFYKKTREALIRDDRFQAVKRENGLFFGLEKWKDSVSEFCREIAADVLEIAKSLKEKSCLQKIGGKNESFPSSKELANASYRTLDYGGFCFFCTLHALFDLLNKTGQFGDLVPEIVRMASRDEGGSVNNEIENIPSEEPPYVAAENEGGKLAEGFFDTLQDSEKKLLALYIFPKAAGQKVTRADVVSVLGYNNEVTMRNRETDLIRRIREYACEHEFSSNSELCEAFLVELEERVEASITFRTTGHSCIDKEDK